MLSFSHILSLTLGGFLAVVPAVVAKPIPYARVLANGIPIRMALDLPEGEVRLHMAVHDLTAARIGSLEVPLKIAAQ